MGLSDLVLAALLCARSWAEDALVLQPKNIDIALTARWPVTSFAVEAAEFLAEESNALFWSYV